METDKDFTGITGGRLRQPYNRDAIADPYKLLALAVITAAIADYKRGDAKARRWLLSEAPGWLEGCGADFDPDWWQSWVNCGCPNQNKRAKRQPAPDLAEII